VKATDVALRFVLTTLHSLRKSLWYISRPKTFGAHAIALTPAGKIILVKLRYSPGWGLPGGGRSEEEPAVDAALRELREEIGMMSHGEVRPAGDFHESTGFKRDTAQVVVVRNVVYRPRWNLEVERVCEADLDSLPPDLSPISRRWIETIRPSL
jgi:8-oxo-dGTP pyrophosphatase MutT (NUDIX family)